MERGESIQGQIFQNIEWFVFLLLKFSKFKKYEEPQKGWSYNSKLLSENFDQKQVDIFDENKTYPLRHRLFLIDVCYIHSKNIY